MKLPTSYTLRARVAPVMLAVSPLTVLVLSFIPAMPWPSSLSTLLGSCGITLLGQLGRDLGRRSEPALFQMWGGAPTTARLRFQGSTNPTAVERTHRLLKATLVDVNIPDRQTEEADPAAADQAYEVAIRSLRELTRDPVRFRLVFEENVNYGFRRNLRALKRIGVTACAFTLGICVLAGVPLGLFVMHQAAVTLLAPVLCAALGLWLWPKADDNWVRTAAEAYADRLIGSLEILATTFGG